MQKTVVITGAGRGLGFELTRQHLELGDCVYALYRSESAQLNDLKNRYENLYLQHIDVSDTASVKAAFGALDCETIDILYSNAGVYRFADEVPFEKLDVSHAAWMYEINAVGFVRVVQTALPKLKRGSVICGISSNAGSVGLQADRIHAPGDRYPNLPYMMSKAAMNSAGCVIKYALEGQGIPILLIMPGWMFTDMGGPNAPVDPVESAARIIGQTAQPDLPPVSFKTYDGQTLPW